MAINRLVNVANSLRMQLITANAINEQNLTIFNRIKPLIKRFMQRVSRQISKHARNANTSAITFFYNVFSNGPVYPPRPHTRFSLGSLTRAWEELHSARFLSLVGRTLRRLVWWALGVGKSMPNKTLTHPKAHTSRHSSEPWKIGFGV